jgi:hypothetical protein
VDLPISGKARQNEKPISALASMAKFLLALMAVGIATLIGVFVYLAFTL